MMVLVTARTYGVSGVAYNRSNVFKYFFLYVLIEGHETQSGSKTVGSGL